LKPIQDSFAGKLEAPARYQLSTTDDEIKIEFEVDQPAFQDSSVAPGVFHEGLWRFDCGELWLASSVSSRYLEFNLSPSGAWWSCAFSEARVRDTNCAPPQVISSGEVSETGWRACLSVSMSEVRRCLGDDNEPNTNVTLVLGGCPDTDPPLENLLSVVRLKEVDFHRPQDWIPITEFLQK
jgi:hypothetical protein